jgi:hypothetical protein
VKWQKLVADVVKRLDAALEPDDVDLGGETIHNLKVPTRQQSGRQRQRVSWRASVVEGC